MTSSPFNAATLSMSDAVKLANWSYNPGIPPPPGFSKVDIGTDPYINQKASNSNASVVSVTGTNTYVITFAGTASASDLVADGVIGEGKLPTMAKDALEEGIIDVSRKVPCLRSNVAHCAAHGMTVVGFGRPSRMLVLSPARQ